MHLRGVHPAILLLLPPLIRLSVPSTTFPPFLHSKKLCQWFFGSLVLCLRLRNRRTRNRKPESLEFRQVFRRFTQRNRSPSDRSRWNKYRVSFFLAVLYLASYVYKQFEKILNSCNLMYWNSSFNIFRRFLTSFNIVTNFFIQNYKDKTGKFAKILSIINNI